jgi:hypothetical protein
MNEIFYKNFETRIYSRIFYDPVFYRIIIDFDSNNDENKHSIKDWLLLN